VVYRRPQEGEFVIIFCKTSERTLANSLSQELIKVRGFQVAPPELEGVLLSHPDIVDCAVIGVADPVRTGDEVPRGYVVRRPGSSGPSDKELHAFMRERLSSFKMLEGGIRWVESIPKTASGKILKRVLREEVKRESGAKL
jgi:4-coumarate--CoA ligase